MQRQPTVIPSPFTSLRSLHRTQAVPFSITHFLRLKSRIFFAVLSFDLAYEKLVA
jgi:hypothetical protein